MHCGGEVQVSKHVHCSGAVMEATFLCSTAIGAHLRPPATQSSLLNRTATRAQLVSCTFSGQGLQGSEIKLDLGDVKNL